MAGTVRLAPLVTDEAGGVHGVPFVSIHVAPQNNSPTSPRGSGRGVLVEHA